MKKLMVAFTAVAMAIAANAGSVDWTICDVVSPATGYGYLFDSSVSATDVENAVLAGTFFTDYASSAVYESGAFTTEYESYTILSGEYSGSTTLWMLALDGNTKDTAKNYFIGEDVTKSIGNSGEKTFDWTYADNTTEWQSVPEPTSGLLLLLGVAGLALRRRRA